MDNGVAGKAYVIGGGSTGLGFACAQALVAGGARVVIISRDEQKLAIAADAMGPNCITIAGDLNQEKAAEHACGVTIANFGRIDGAFLNTGGPQPSTARMTTAQAWRIGFEQVFLATVNFANTVLRHTEVVNHQPVDLSLLLNLSSSVFQPIPGLALSNAFRPALAGYLRDLAVELGPLAVRVNGIAPGRIATDRVYQLDAAVGDAESVRAAHESHIPLRRYGDPAEFGNAAAFLLSPAASYITGVVLPVDGGLLLSR